MSLIASHWTSACGLECGHEQSLVGFRQPRFYCIIRNILLGFGLFCLMQREVERLFIAYDELPCKEAAHCVFEVLEAILVRGKKYERVSEDTRRAPSRSRISFAAF